MQTYIQTIFNLTHPEEEVWPGGTKPMLLSESGCVHIPSLRFVAPRACLAKVPFLSPSFWPYTNTGRGMAL